MLTRWVCGGSWGSWGEHPSQPCIREGTVPAAPVVGHTVCGSVMGMPEQPPSSPHGAGDPGSAGAWARAAGRVSLSAALKSSCSAWKESLKTLGPPDCPSSLLGVNSAGGDSAGEPRAGRHTRAPSGANMPSPDRSGFAAVNTRRGWEQEWESAVPSWGSRGTAVLAGGWAHPVQEQNPAIHHCLGAGTGRGEGAPTRAQLWGSGVQPGPGPAHRLPGCATGPRCWWMLAQVGIHCLAEGSAIWSASEFWEHLLSWIITCPVSCIPSTPPN